MRHIPGKKRGRPRVPKHVIRKCAKHVGDYVWILMLSGAVVEGQLWKPPAAPKERVERIIFVKEWDKQLAPLGRHGLPNGQVTRIRPSYIVKIKYLWDDTEEVLLPTAWEVMQGDLTFSEKCDTI